MKKIKNRPFAIVNDFDGNDTFESGTWAPICERNGVVKQSVLQEAGQHLRREQQARRQLGLK